MNGYNAKSKIRLSDDGLEKKTNCYWVHFVVDYFAEQLPGECCICGAELESGYLCLDGGDEVCSEHVVIEDDR